MSLETFEVNVRGWAEAKGLYPAADADHETKLNAAKTQCLKAVAEMGELADGLIDDEDREMIQDHIGDVMVCLVNVAAIYNLGLEYCADTAWNEIKDRTGKVTLGGAFKKD